MIVQIRGLPFNIYTINNKTWQISPSQLCCMMHLFISVHKSSQFIFSVITLVLVLKNWLCCYCRAQFALVPVLIVAQTIIITVLKIIKFIDAVAFQHLVFQALLSSRSFLNSNFNKHSKIILKNITAILLD